MHTNSISHSKRNLHHAMWTARFLPLTQKQHRNAPSTASGEKGSGRLEQSQFTAWVANSQHPPLGVGTTVTTPTPQPSRSPHPQAAKSIPSHLAPGSCTPKGRMESGGHTAPTPLCPPIGKKTEVGHSPPPLERPSPARPLPASTGCKLFEGQVLPPQGSSLHPKNLPLGLPTIG